MFLIPSYFLSCSSFRWFSRLPDCLKIQFRSKTSFSFPNLFGCSANIGLKTLNFLLETHLQHLPSLCYHYGKQKSYWQFCTLWSCQLTNTQENGNRYVKISLLTTTYLFILWKWKALDKNKFICGEAGYMLLISIRKLLVHSLLRNITLELTRMYNIFIRNIWHGWKLMEYNQNDLDKIFSRLQRVTK